MIQFRTYISFPIILSFFFFLIFDYIYFLLWGWRLAFLHYFVFVSFNSGEQETLLISVHARYCVPRRASIGLLDYFLFGVTLLDTICHKCILDFLFLGKYFRSSIYHP